MSHVILSQWSTSRVARATRVVLRLLRRLAQPVRHARDDDDARPGVSLVPPVSTLRVRPQLRHRRRGLARGRGANGRFARATSADDGAECTASNSADVRGIEGKSVVAEARADDGVSAPGGGDARSRMRREGNPRRRDRRDGESAA